MESPIPEQFWTVLLNTATAALTAAVGWSLLAQRRAALSVQADEFRAIADPQATEADVVAALESIRARLTDEGRSQGGLSRVVLWANLPKILALLEKSLKNETPTVAEHILRTINRGIGDAEGRRRFAQAGGLQPLLQCLSVSHARGLRTLLDEASTTLATVVRTSEEGAEPGSEVAQQLATHAAAPKLLRMLRPDNPPAFLQSIGSVMCSVAQLRKGAAMIAAGVDGQRGVAILRPLLSHHNAMVLDLTLRTLAALARNDQGADLVDAALLRDVYSHLTDPKAVRQTMGATYIVFCALGSVVTAEKFAVAWVATNGAVAAMVAQWCRSPDSRARDVAEATVQRLEKIPAVTAAVRAEKNAMSAEIAEREAMDEEQRRKMMKQNRQQAMLQQMMMMQQGGNDDE